MLKRRFHREKKRSDWKKLESVIFKESVSIGQILPMPIPEKLPTLTDADADFNGYNPKNQNVSCTQNKIRMIQFVCKSNVNFAYHLKVPLLTKKLEKNVRDTCTNLQK